MAEVGAPSKYKERYCLEAEKYLFDCKDKKDGEEFIVDLPTIESFALRLDVCEKTLYNWAKENEEFLQSLNKIKIEQKKRLLNKGLSGHYNSTIAKLILSANHNMREKQDLTTDGHRIPQPIYAGKSTKSTEESGAKPNVEAAHDAGGKV